jgi:hypothetical protein
MVAIGMDGSKVFTGIRLGVWHLVMHSLPGLR